MSTKSRHVLSAAGGQWVIVETVNAAAVLGAAVQVHVHEVISTLSWKKEICTRYTKLYQEMFMF